MKASKYREKTVEELQQEERSLRDQLLRLRFQKVAGSMENPQKQSVVRKDIARILTILREKQGAASGPKGKGRE